MTLALGVMLGPARRRTGDRRARRPFATTPDLGRGRIAVYLGLVIADFAWMWPMFTGGLLTYDQWHAHMWLPSWV